jgi:hypothetical protein
MRGLVEKDRMEQVGRRDLSCESIGEEEVAVRHVGEVWQYRRAKADVTVFHWWATRAAGRRAMGMALLMVEGRPQSQVVTGLRKP